ncbi:hypothetical protein G6F56_014339 [Rhizopus delemar]|nr:hypothetical protein G6F32_016171 [Rhizopus arrhizus]KAG1381501.1 hypothetical protein G6F59_017904 [Rhizopus arrhizus]KAG1434369.1 hypothetical protein G6F56_014339 [Rhizopus delemar]
MPGRCRPGTGHRRGQATAPALRQPCCLHSLPRRQDRPGRPERRAPPARCCTTGRTHTGRRQWRAVRRVAAGASSTPKPAAPARSARNTGGR